jgi:limonene 1,2-monooxygenase
VATNREYFNRAREAVMAKITENEAAAAALKVTKSPLLAASSSNVPDLEEARARLEAR